MPTYVWPSVLKARAPAQFTPVPRSRGGGVSLSGVEQVVSSGAGIWKATIGNVAIRTSDQIRLWRSLQALLQGRVNPVLVSPCDAARTPWPLDGTGRPIMARDDIPHDDGTLFSDGAGYGQNVIVAYSIADAARGATALTFNIDVGSALAGGEHFSIGERLYRIVTVDGGETGLGGFSYTVGIWPPLRDAAPAGSALEFDRPRCRMRLAIDDAMDVDLDLNRFASPSVTFLEDL